MQRRRAAERRIKDHASTAPTAGTSLLPPPGAAFDEVDGPPAFLDPEATRPLADSLHRQRLQRQAQAAQAAQAARDRSNYQAQVRGVE